MDRPEGSPFALKIEFGTSICRASKGQAVLFLRESRKPPRISAIIPIIKRVMVLAPVWARTPFSVDAVSRFELSVLFGSPFSGAVCASVGCSTGVLIGVLGVDDPIPDEGDAPRELEIPMSGIRGTSGRSGSRAHTQPHEAEDNP
ncbi:hypothetical protein M0E84_10020, partial [Corynebacterium sp. CCM 9186]